MQEGQRGSVYKGEPASGHQSELSFVLVLVLVLKIPFRSIAGRSLNSFGDPSEHCLVQLCTLSCSCAFQKLAKCTEWMPEGALYRTRQNSRDSILQMAILQAAACKIFLCIECNSADRQIAIPHLVILPSKPLTHNANPARYAAARKITHINFQSMRNTIHVYMRYMRYILLEYKKYDLQKLRIPPLTTFAP